jgi:hypothetical protein
MVRNKQIRAKSMKMARNHTVSLGGVVLAVVLFIIGIAAFKGGYTNIGPVFMAFGALVTFISVMPMFSIPGWAMGVITLGAIAIVVLFTIPYLETMATNFNVFMEELPTHIWEWLWSQSPI